MAKQTGDPLVLIGFNAAGLSVSASLYWDPGTGAIHDDPTAGAALVVVNNTGGTCPCVLTDVTTQQAFTVNVPKGTRTASAAQLAAQGYTHISQVSFSLTVPSGA